MAYFLLILCLGLALACAIIKWLLVQEISKLRVALAGRVAERQKLVTWLHQQEFALEYEQIQERELVNDCRTISTELVRSERE